MTDSVTKLRDKTNQVATLSMKICQSGEALLSVPPPSQVQLVRIQDKAFSVAASRLWNSLPLEARLGSVLAVLSLAGEDLALQASFP